MMLTITLILSALIVLNFLLLVFSCNKTTKKTIVENPVVIKAVKPQKPTKQLTSTQLAPTGS